MSSSDTRSNFESVLELSNPILIQSFDAKASPSSMLTLDSTELVDLETDTSDSLQLNLKPSFKLDKKTKKIEKDDDSDTSKVRNKLKKKSRVKVDFDDEYDSISEEDNDSDSTSNVASLSLERPSVKKQDSSSSKSIFVKQKPSASSGSKKKKKNTSATKRNSDTKVPSRPENVTISGPLTIPELSELLVINDTEIIKVLFFKGISVTMNQVLDVKTAILVGEEVGVEVTFIENQEEDPKKLELFETDKLTHEKRPPIIAVMGHVDHGKTSLLDYIRNTQTAKKESGGITQKLGAYEVELDYKEQKRKLVFLDTPGHEAFSGMRSRGIQVTDIAILVVAADDGVRPQTIEAIKYIQSSNVPLIVAINKIDKEDANVENIKQELSKYNLIPESWGGDTLMVPISAKQGTNIDNLLELIVLLSEVETLTADPTANAQGTILESHIDRTKGAIASLLVQNGTLKVGDILVAGDSIAKIRGILDSNGERVSSVSPSSPALIWGLSKAPKVGDIFTIYSDEKEAKLAVQKVQDQDRGTSISQTLNENYNISDLELKGKINLIIKTDIQGSVEAIVNTIYKMSHPKVQIKVLYAAPGEITETDIDFAYTSNATVLAFNTTLASGARKAAKNSNVIVKESDVIYDLFDYVQDMIDLVVGPEYDEQFIGSATVKNIFPLGKSFVAGSFVSEGKLVQGCHIKIMRNAEVVYEGSLDSLKRLKDDVLEVKENLECGIFVKDFDTWSEADVIRAFNLIEKKRSR
uniref:Translation initiation factor IF-2, chloroplastic n=1 Tax=Chroomonas placoidea TaxID=173977 RepID=A0A222AI90_9CRYP|nr:translation initiation factor 2 [Chroomonas placoidea]ASO76086.1 translation initiation factor 2 [Chroomonas placoidea]